MTTVTAPAHNRLQAVFLKGHLKLMSIGMKNSTFTGRQMLDKASAISGVSYKRGQYDLAVQDMQKIIDSSKEDVPT